MSSLGTSVYKQWVIDIRAGLVTLTMIGVPVANVVGVCNKLAFFTGEHYFIEIFDKYFYHTESREVLNVLNVEELTT
jgi:hypothetical protein